jgi:hypothetical protein
MPIPVSGWKGETAMKLFKDCFQLQLAPKEIEGLASRYLDNDSRARGDNNAFNAGHCIAEGKYSRANLEFIFRWKTGGRGVSRLSANTDNEIEDALRLAVEASSDRGAIAVLCGLDGVDVPVASAILTAIKPERYTIIDFRALESLGTKNPSINIDFYLAYLKECRDLAGKHGVSLRTLDRALWQWSNEKKPPTEG